jgi:cation transport ATPase
MPTRKQRRRDQKSRRHEYEYVYVDGQGNEVEVEPSELRTEKKNGKADTRPRNAAKRSPANERAIQPPSWRRAFRRAVIWAPVLVIVMMLLNRNVSPMQWLTSAVFLIAFFIPISYFTDAMAYRVYRKRVDRVNAAKR